MLCEVFSYSSFIETFLILHFNNMMKIHHEHGANVHGIYMLTVSPTSPQSTYSIG